MSWQVWLARLFDLAAVALAWAVSFVLRYNFDVPPHVQETILTSLPWAVAVHAAAFHGFGLYRGMWRFASLPDLKRILQAVGVAALVLPLLLFMIAPVVERRPPALDPGTRRGADPGARRGQRGGAAAAHAGHEL
jgi:FlaA1/EpsC-like NDP-sugar epimerase